MGSIGGTEILLFLGLLAAAWVACAVGCGRVASNRGHGVAGWMVVGLFLGPLGLALALLLQPKNAENHPAP